MNGNFSDSEFSSLFPPCLSYLTSKLLSHAPVHTRNFSSSPHCLNHWPKTAHLLLNSKLEQGLLVRQWLKPPVVAAYHLLLGPALPSISTRGPTALLFLHFPPYFFCLLQRANISSLTLEHHPPSLLRHPGPESILWLASAQTCTVLGSCQIWLSSLIKGGSLAVFGSRGSGTDCLYQLCWACASCVLLHRPA